MRKETWIVIGASALVLGGALLVLKKIEDRVKDEGEKVNAVLAPAGPADTDRSWFSRFFWGSKDDSLSPAGVLENMSSLWGSPSGAATNNQATAPQSAPFGYNSDGSPSSGETH